MRVTIACTVGVADLERGLRLRRPRWLLAILATSVLAQMPQPASTASATTPMSVAAGCATPTVKPGRHAFYVDPNKGSMSGDGSKAHPWRTFAEVVDVRNRLFANAPATFIKGVGVVKPDSHAPIESGDIIYLLNGNHGSILLQGNFGTNQLLYGYDNADFVTVAAAPGQTPIIKKLTLKGVGKWLFQGITFESLQDVPSNKGQPFTNKIAGTGDYFLAELFGPNKDVIFFKNSFQTLGDTQNWTANDWMHKRVSGLVDLGGSCLSFLEGNYHDIGFAIVAQRSRFITIKGNNIDTFTDDGIDYGSSDLLIEDNKITNAIVDGDGFHQDAMQGQPLGQIPVENVIINRNTVINQTRDLMSAGNLQGIDTFDGVWRNVTITNNVVATNTYHGITFSGVTGIKIINNTVIATSPKIPTWIAVGKSKDKRESSDVTVENNIATSFSIDPDNHFSHNMMASPNSEAIRKFKPNDHVFANQEPVSIFVKYNNSFHSYDFHLSLSRAIGTGEAQGAPPFGRDGLARKPPIDLGAFVYKPGG